MLLPTVGHGARSADELLEVLRSAAVEVVADVRRFPGSRRHPHFGRAEMERWLADAGVRYEFHGEALGGRRGQRPDSRHVAWRNDAFRGYADHMDSDVFRGALDGLLARTETVAVMCSETLWWRCHRRLIADAAAVRGAQVVHLVSATGHQEHPPHEGLRVGEDGWPVYDVGGDRPLPL